MSIEHLLHWRNLVPLCRLMRNDVLAALKMMLTFGQMMLTFGQMMLTFGQMMLSPADTNEKPRSEERGFLSYSNNFEPNIYINNPVNLTLLFNVSITVKETSLFPLVSSFNSAFSDEDFTIFSICSS